MIITANFRFMLHVFWRWLDRYKVRIFIGLILVITSLILVTEPAWVFSAADALRIPYAIFSHCIYSVFSNKR